LVSEILRVMFHHGNRRGIARPSLLIDGARATPDDAIMRSPFKR
jgi:hypothetical protein